MSFFPEDAFDVFDTNEDEVITSVPIHMKRYSEEEAEKSKKLKSEEQDIIVKPSKLKSQVLDEFSTQVQLDKGEELGELTHSVRHEVAIPMDYNYVPLSQHVPFNPAFREYPFKLDPFQQSAVYCIERNESVLVSAHTSAGKTVVAEYAISMALKSKQRIIYTSPIKALSNQKYREFQQEFVDVGLMTGDVTINPSASCLVMTTEILRSMLYRGSEVMREVAWVVFDEVHYMRDKERGVVWEETLILLPDKVHFVFLSATIPNAKQFAEWICQIHQQPCHVVYTDYRPTPLQHYLFPAGGDGIHLVVDEKGVFREENFVKALSILGVDEDPLGSSSRRKKKKITAKEGQSDLFKIIKMIMIKNYHPVIVFSFSKRECEGNALQLSKIDFNNDDEKALVENVFVNALDSLSDDDKNLPQIENLLPLLKRGVGIHHSGLLPILKEVIEILFQEGLIKVLFATETFSIGLNMPAKTVVFTDSRKFDGKEMRFISSGEYIQMSGRAGRRGLDDRGIVIQMLDERITPMALKTMIKGKSDLLNSAFHLTYNMILNLLRFEGINPEYILEKSFFQFQNNNNLPELENKLYELDQKKKAIIVEHEDIVGAYYEMKKQIESFQKDYNAIIYDPSNCLSFLQPGRLVRIKTEQFDYGWGCLVSFQKKKKPKADNGNLFEYVLDVLLYCEKDGSKGNLVPKPCVTKGEFIVVPVLISTLAGLSSVRIRLPKELNTDSRYAVLKSFEEVKRRLDGEIPLLDPIKDLGIKDESFMLLVQKIGTLQEKFKEMEKRNKDRLSEQNIELYQDKQRIIEEMTNIQKEIKKTRSIIHMDELKSRKRVLRRLEFTSASDIIQLKGRVACEISTGALLSCFVNDERSKSTAQGTKLEKELSEPLLVMQQAARRIAQVCNESKLEVNVEEYVGSFQYNLMDVVYAWCKGAKFVEVCKMTDTFEGSIIRVMKRLEELLRQMVAAAKSIGNTEIENKFAEGINMIKRDIVFANSLYL